MNPRILGSVVSIFTVLSLMAGATYALFTAQATNAGNTFGSGNLTLIMNPGASPSPGPAFTVTNAVPGQTFTQLLNLENSGNVPASSVSIAALAVTGGPNLQGQLTLQFFTDANADGEFDVVDGDEFIPGSGKLNDPTWVGWTIPGVTLPASGGEYKLGVMLTFDTTGTAQNEDVSFDLTLQANQ